MLVLVGQILLIGEFLDGRPQNHGIVRPLEFAGHARGHLGKLFFDQLDLFCSLL